MTYLTNLIDLENFCPLSGLAILVFLVGTSMVSKRPKLNRLGVQVSGAAFIFFVLFLGFTESPQTAGEWLAVTVRGLLAAALTLGTAWIALAATSVANDLFIVPIVRFFRSIRNGIYNRLERHHERKLEMRAQREKQEALHREEEERERTAQEREHQQRQAEARQKREMAEGRIGSAEAERQEEEREGPERRRVALHEVMTYFAEQQSKLEPWIGFQKMKRLAQRTINEEPLSRTAARRAKQLKSLIDLYLLRADLRSVYTCLWDAVAQQVPEETEDEFLRRTGYEQLVKQSMNLTEEEFTSRVTSFRTAADEQGKLLRRYYTPLQPEREAAEQQQEREFERNLRMSEFDDIVDDLRQQFREQWVDQSEEEIERAVEKHFRHEPHFAEWKKWKKEG